MDECNVAEAIHAFARRRARRFIANAGPELVSRLGGEEAVVRRCLRDAQRATKSLSVPPVERLGRTVAYWIDILKVATDGRRPPPGFDPEDEELIALECDGMLLARLVEIDAALRSGDVDGAFRMLRSIHDARKEDGDAPTYVAIPDSLDPDSAYWLDLNQDN